jgi:hypothetical protein
MSRFLPTGSTCICLEVKFNQISDLLEVHRSQVFLTSLVDCKDKKNTNYETTAAKFYQFCSSGYRNARSQEGRLDV